MSTMNRSNLHFVKFVVLTLALGSTTLSAGTASGTTVYTEPAGGSFYVDGQFFTDSATFLWPQGSKHTLDIDAVQTDLVVKTRHSFTGWTDSTGILSVSTPHLVITADPAITFYKATMTLQYAVSLNFFTCPGGDVSFCGSPGTVLVNDIPYLVNTDVYLDAGSAVNLRAVPNAGYVFTGWSNSVGTPGQAYLSSFTLNAPVTVYPQFLRAGTVTIASDPPTLQVLADTTAVYTPATLDWGIGTTHTVGAVTPQIDLHGKRWVFSAWSDAGDATHAYTMQSAASVTLTAKYVPGGPVVFVTNPPGLKLIVDGRDNWPVYSFAWAAGVQHTISAPVQQVDANGHGWAFKSWSNGGPATQTIALSSSDVIAGLRLTATYVPSSQTTGQAVIQSSPSGVTVKANGSDCLTPCTLSETIGSKLYVSVPSSVQLSGDSRLQFAEWTDGATGDRSITVIAGSQTFTANYQTYYRLVCTADPYNAVTWRFAPASTDGFYAAGTQVTIWATVASAYRFDGWQGDATGTASSVTVTMDRPRSVEAKLTRVASDGIDAIRNAAGETPEAGVAPGSIISIYGPKLASSIQTGPDSPLAQTLAGVTATVADRLLPLLFVSPGQINAQLPGDLAEGAQTLVVHSNSQPDVTGPFTAQRNAPGLFSQQIAGRPYLIALHQDGSLVTPQKPARRGELITALGTGFGPYQIQPPDGFAVPGTGHYELVDHAELAFGDKVIEPEFAGAAPARVGITAIRFRVADPLPVATTIEIKARINGHESNTVLFPLE